MLCFAIKLGFDSPGIVRIGPESSVSVGGMVCVTAEGRVCFLTYMRMWPPYMWHRLPSILGTEVMQSLEHYLEHAK